MSDTPNAETELRIAYKQLVDEVGEATAADILSDLHSEVRECQMFDEEFTVGAAPAQVEEEEEEEEDTEPHEFDDDARRFAEVGDEGHVVVDGNRARQEIAGEVSVSEVDDGQLVLVGDTYDAKGHVKAVDYRHREFDGDRKVWLVDEDVIEDLHIQLNGGGYLFTDARDVEEDDESEGPDPADQLQTFIDSVAEDDRVEIEYEMKNGNGTNTKEGVVEKIKLPDEEYREVPQLVFMRDDDQRMYVEPDYEYDETLALYTSMSHAPFVGDVEGLVVLEGGDAQ